MKCLKQTIHVTPPIPVNRKLKIVLPDNPSRSHPIRVSSGYLRCHTARRSRRCYGLHYHSLVLKPRTFVTSSQANCFYLSHFVGHSSISASEILAKGGLGGPNGLGEYRGRADSGPSLGAH